MRRVLFALVLASPLAGCDFVDLIDPDALPPAPEAGTPWVAMIDAVNEQRAEGARCGGEWYPPAPPLAWNGALEAAAARHSRDMAENRFFSHEGSDGSRVGERATQAGYAWSRVGENLARMDVSVRAVVAAWVDSAPHCRGMMDERYTEMGVAERDAYWTQVFGRPR
ncbi:MAG: CAP domain-containing protein [Bacteroidota bacterium]